MMEHRLSRMLCCCAAALFFRASAAKAEDPCSVCVLEEHSQQAIQSALNRVTSPGTVILTPGRYEINSSLLVRSADLTLRGSDITPLPPCDVPCFDPDQTVLYWTRDGANSALIKSINHQRVRITGIRFEGVISDQSTGQEVGVAMVDTVDFRVDNCFFTRTGFAGVKVSGASSGVVDHCEFNDLFKPDAGLETGYGVDVEGTGQLEGEPFGSGNATFIEDSSFRLCRHAVASNAGARYVFRHNFVTQNRRAHAVDAHGQENNQPFAGTEWVDVNNNQIEDPALDSTRWAVRIRGGTGLVWSNTVTGYDLGVKLTQDTPADAGTPPFITGPIYIWENELVVRDGGQPEPPCDTQPTSPMVCATGRRGTPTFELSPPPDYVPFPYPHPLASP